MAPGTRKICKQSKWSQEDDLGYEVLVRRQTNQLPRRERCADSSETSVDKTGEDAEETSGGAALTENSNRDQ